MKKPILCFLAALIGLAGEGYASAQTPEYLPKNGATSVGTGPGNAVTFPGSVTAQGSFNNALNVKHLYTTGGGIYSITGSLSGSTAFQVGENVTYNGGNTATYVGQDFRNGAPVLFLMGLNVPNYGTGFNIVGVTSGAQWIPTGAPIGASAMGNGLWANITNSTTVYWTLTNGSSTISCTGCAATQAPQTSSSVGMIMRVGLNSASIGTPVSAVEMDGVITSVSSAGGTTTITLGASPYGGSAPVWTGATTGSCSSSCPQIISQFGNDDWAILNAVLNPLAHALSSAVSSQFLLSFNSIQFPKALYMVGAPLTIARGGSTVEGIGVSRGNNATGQNGTIVQFAGPTPATAVTLNAGSTPAITRTAAFSSNASSNGYGHLRNLMFLANNYVQEDFVDFGPGATETDNLYFWGAQDFQYVMVGGIGASGRNLAYTTGLTHTIANVSTWSGLAYIGANNSTSGGPVSLIGAVMNSAPGIGLCVGGFYADGLSTMGLQNSSNGTDVSVGSTCNGLASATSNVAKWTDTGSLIESGIVTASGRDGGIVNYGQIKLNGTICEQYHGEAGSTIDGTCGAVEGTPSTLGAFVLDPGTGGYTPADYLPAQVLGTGQMDSLSPNSTALDVNSNPLIAFNSKTFNIDLTRGTNSDLFAYRYNWQGPRAQRWTNARYGVDQYIQSWGAWYIDGICLPTSTTQCAPNTAQTLFWKPLVTASATWRAVFTGAWTNAAGVQITTMPLVTELSSSNNSVTVGGVNLTIAEITSGQTATGFLPGTLVAYSTNATTSSAIQFTGAIQFFPNTASTQPTVSYALGFFTALQLGITGSTQCLQVNSAGNVSGTGSACGSGGGGGMVYPGAGIGVSTGSAWGTSLTAPTGTIVGTSDTQTLTNKTLDGVTPTTMGFVDATSSIQTQLNGKQATLTNPVTGPGSGATVGHLAVMGNTAGTSITDGGAIPTLSSLGGVSTSTTVNGHALSSNVTVSASDLTTGTLPAAQTAASLSSTTSVNGTSIPASATLTTTTSVVNTVVDTSASVTVSTTLGAEVHFNENATAATAITYTLPTAAAGKQFCFYNAYNGSAANTGTLELLTSASGQFIIYTDGTLSATGGYVISAGAARDSACLAGVDSTHWMFVPTSGTWSKH